MQIVYVFKKIPHHANHSGYDRLAYYVDSYHYKPGKIACFLKCGFEKKIASLKRVNYTWYKPESFAIEAEIILRRHFVKNTIFHFLYGEDGYRFAYKNLFRRKNRIVVSFHQPKSIFFEPFSKEDVPLLKKIDRIVAVGKKQAEFLRELVGNQEQVEVVPHGIDVDFYKPDYSKKNDEFLETISVGWWLRDVDMIKEIIKKVNSLSLKVKFNIVTFDWCFKFYEGLKNVNLFTNISDEKLLELYQRSHLLLLPLKDCTANNAVLESMACGLPVFTTEVGDIKDYCSLENSLFTKSGDADYLVDGIKEYYKNREKLVEMGKKSRDISLNFRWENIANRFLELYRGVME